MENVWNFKLRINITESSHMAELNGVFSITKLLWLMTDRGCNSNPVMVSTGCQGTLPFFLFCVSGFPSHAEGCF